MKMTLKLIVAAAFLGVVSSGRSQTPPDSSDGKAGLRQLAWMQGTWIKHDGNRRNQEIWTDVAGNSMMGIARTTDGNRTVSFEFMRIVQSANGEVVFLASPSGRCPATPFPMKEHSKQRVVFENKTHDFPQRIMYWKGDDGSLHARIEGTIDGELRHMEWSWPHQSAG